MKINAFAYWDSDDHTILQPFADEWSSHFPDFRIYGDANVIPLLQNHVLGLDFLFQSIQFGSPKSDIARMALLYEYGGLFTDTHFGIEDIDGLRDVIALTEKYEAVFVWRTYRTQSHRPKDQITPIAGFILARPKSEIIRAFLLTAAQRLTVHWRQMQAGQVLFPYSVWHMIGAGNMERVLLEPGTNRTRIRREFAERITFVQEDGAPFRRNVHNAYRKPDMHWSRRQGRETLFKDFDAYFRDLDAK